MANREILRTENVRVRIMELEPGGCTDLHTHTEVADFFVCLRGSIRVETRGPDGTTLLLPGGYAEVPAGRVHRCLNVHDDGSEYLLIQGVGAYDFRRAD